MRRKMTVYITLKFDFPAEKSLENLHLQTQEFLWKIGVDVESSTTEISADILATEQGALRVRYNPNPSVKEG